MDAFAGVLRRGMDTQKYAHYGNDLGVVIIMHRRLGLIVSESHIYHKLS